jgi:glyoxalase family protein
MTGLAGLHHVSALSARIDRSHDFYARVLGMRPLARTVNQDEPTMYHLFYGDGAGTAGSEMTVFDLPHAAPGIPGNRTVSRTAFRVAGHDALDRWAERFDALGVPRGEVAERDGRATLDFADPVGTQLALVDDGGAGAAFPWPASPVPVGWQLRGLGYTTISVPTLEGTDAFLTGGLGLVPDHDYADPQEPADRVHVYRIGDGGAHAEVHVVVRPGLPDARYGSGSVHHVALRVPAAGSIDAWAERLSGLGWPNSGVVDRHYFASVYAREPSGVLFELATDGPGFDVDGPLDGERLSLPPFLEPRRAEIEARLTPIAPVGA